MSFWHYIDPIDRWLIWHVNQAWGNPVFDFLMPFLRETATWLPLYLFLILFVIINFGIRGLWWVIAFLLTVASADLISGQVVKPLVMRMRPCQDVVVGQQLRFFIKY
ncbi:MAG: hypothetical protein ABW036_04020, partial [Flavitalea sp.]